MHGLAFDRSDVLYAGSVVGESIYRVDVRTGEVETVVGPPQGMADDLVFLEDGSLVWTAISQGVVRLRAPDGSIREIAKLPSVNSINVRRSDGRLFVGQVFGADGVWELDPAGVRPPRSIVKDVGGFNGFDIGADGMLYGPLWFKGQVVRIDPDSGEVKVVAGDFATPAAANFDSKGNLYVLDTASGEVVQVDVKSGQKRVVARLATSLDNLAIDSRDRLFVSNMADNSIHEVDVRTGEAREVVKGGLAMPLALAAVREKERDVLYLADVFAVRQVDGVSGAVTDLARSHAANASIGYPIGVFANRRHVIIVNNEGPVQRYDRSDMRLVQEWSGLHGAQSVLELSDGNLVVTLPAQGKVVMTYGASGLEHKPVANGLAAPTGIAPAADRAVYVSETGAGRIVRVHLDAGVVTAVAQNLDRPQGLALASDGALLVVEAGKKQVTRIHPRTRAREVIVSDLPIGLPIANSFVSLAVGAKGVVYVTSDIENSIWRLTPRR